MAPASSIVFCVHLLGEHYLIASIPRNTILEGPPAVSTAVFRFIGYKRAPQQSAIRSIGVCSRLAKSGVSGQELGRRNLTLVKALAMLTFWNRILIFCEGGDC